MKKILFRKILFDCLLFFLITLVCVSTIIWVFQAVNFLDIIVEDGRNFWVYLNYTLLNFPKIINKIIPFSLFFSFCYVLNKYEQNNELIIFWNHGVHKIEIINLFLKFSLFLVILQILISAFLVPSTQNFSRSLIRESSVDFFESFVKPKKFNDNIKGLTIYADDKISNGKLKNIYLKKDGSDKKYQITVAKTGEFINFNNAKVLVLYDGQTLNLINDKVTIFNFSKSDFVLSNLDSDVIVQDKIQETSTKDIINCLKKYFKPNLSAIKNPPKFVDVNCNSNNLNNVFQEIYKRFIIPFYLPFLILISLLLILGTKENLNYNKYKFIIFFIGLIIVILSESSLKFVQDNFYSNFKIFLIPIILTIVLYFYFQLKLLNRIKNNS